MKNNRFWALEVTIITIKIIVFLVNKLLQLVNETKLFTVQRAECSLGMC